VPSGVTAPCLPQSWHPGCPPPGCGTHAQLTPCPPPQPHQNALRMDSRNPHAPSLLPAPATGHPGWLRGPSVPLLPGTRVMLPSSPGVLLTATAPAAERGLPAPARGHAPRPRHPLVIVFARSPPAADGTSCHSRARPPPVAVPRGQLLGPSSRRGLGKGGPGSPSPMLPPSMAPSWAGQRAWHQAGRWREMGELLRAQAGQHVWPLLMPPR